MKNNKWIIIGAIVALFLVVSGITYAYFFAKITGNEKTSTINLEAGTLEIVLDGGNSIVANSIIPSSTPFATKNFTVIGNNDSNGNMPYNINIVVDNNTYTDESITYTLVSTNTSNNGKVVVGREYQVVDQTLTIGSGYFEQGRNSIHTYTISFYFLETNTDQSENMRATFAAHIEIGGLKAEKPAPRGWWKANSTTLLGLIKENSIVHQDTDEGMTVPGQDIAETDEQLRITTDDYGVSFYYRGAVENNYVIFARKCWRIVRITGDGSIKLVLYNNDEANCDILDYSLNFAKYDGEDYSTQFNAISSVSKKAAGIGFMYGDINSNDFFSIQSNITDSTILTNLKAWYDNIDRSGEENIPTFTNIEKEKLADVIWCGDKSIYINTSQISFAAINRLNNPSLICPDIVGNTNLSKYTANDIIYGNGALKGYKIGLLTADEIIFAGGKNLSVNNSFYLATDDRYWTMSPSCYDGFARIIHVSSNAIYTTDSFSYTAYNNNLRPSIALIPSVQAIYDKTSEYKPGTVNNPYVVSVS